MRRKSVLNSIAFRKRGEPARIGLAHAQFLDRMFERHVAFELHQLARDARLVGELRSASRGAWAA